MIFDNVLFFVTCGASTHTIVISFTPDTGLKDPAVFDMILIATNVPGANGKILDSNQDGNPDEFGYPETCGTDLSKAGCGIPLAQAGKFELGKLPTNYTYNLQVRLRDTSGNILYSGASQIQNPPVGDKVSITLVKK